MEQLISFEIENGEKIFDIKSDYYGKNIGIGTESGAIEIFTTNNKGLHKNSEIREHVGPVNKIDFSHPRFGSLLLSGGFDKRVCLFRESINSNYEKIYEYSDHKNIVNFVSFSEFSKYLLFASGSLNGEIVIHRYQNDNFSTSVISGHDFGVNSISFSPENKIISCGNDGLIKIWEENTETGEWTNIDTIETETITTSVAYNPIKKDTFASCGEDGVVIFWQKIKDKWNQKTLMTHLCEMVKVEWNDNGSNLIGIGADGTENLYEEDILTLNE